MMQRRSPFAVAFFGITLLMNLASGQARADVIGFASVAGGDLVTVDFTTVTATTIGNTGINLMEGLALSPGGVLFGTNDSGNLYTINTTTAAATLVGNTGLGDVEGLAFNGNTLVATNISVSTSLFTINTSTATATPLVSSSPPILVARALAITNPTTGLILANSPTGSQELVSIDLGTGASTVLGPINPAGLSAALGNTGGTLYALDSLGFAYTVSPTGNYTALGSTGSQFYLDLTMQPGASASTPEPSSFVLLGIAGAIVLRGNSLRRRRVA